MVGKRCAPTFGVKVSSPGDSFRPFGNRQCAAVTITSGSTRVAVQDVESPMASSLPMAAVQGMGPLGSGGGLAGVSHPTRTAAMAMSPAMAAGKAAGQPDPDLNIGTWR